MSEDVDARCPRIRKPREKRERPSRRVQKDVGREGHEVEGEGAVAVPEATTKRRRKSGVGPINFPRGSICRILVRRDPNQLEADAKIQAEKKKRFENIRQFRGPRLEALPREDQALVVDEDIHTTPKKLALYSLKPKKDCEGLLNADVAPQQLGRPIVPEIGRPRRKIE